MPLAYQVDHARRLVRARALGTLNDADVFAYQREVWSRPDVTGYDELVDLSDATTIEVPVPAGDRFRDLARLAAAMDPPGGGSGRLAVVAPSDQAYGLARMYQAYRALQTPGDGKRIEVFRSREEAWAFLAIAPDPAAAPPATPPAA